MSKKSMLGLFEENGRGRSRARSSHCRDSSIAGSGSLLPWTIQLAGQRENWSGVGELNLWTSTRSVRPSSRVVLARRSTERAAGRQAGKQACRRMAPKSWGQLQRLSHGAKRRAGSDRTSSRRVSRSGGQNPLCAYSGTSPPEL
jgi:hypothetical protein